MTITIIRQATITKEQLLASCPAYAGESLLENPANTLRCYVISVMGKDVVFQVYCGAGYLLGRQGRDPSDERTGVAIFDAFMRGDKI